MIIPTSCAICNQGSYYHQGNPSFLGRAVSSIRSIGKSIKSAATKAAHHIKQRTIEIVKFCKPYMRKIFHALWVLKNYSIRVVVCATAIVRKTTIGLGLGFAAGTAASFIFAPIPAVQAMVPTIQLIATVIGGIGGLLHGIESAKEKWNERIEKENKLLEGKETKKEAKEEMEKSTHNNKAVEQPELVSSTMK